ncbi:MAG: hypothetical protein RIE87_11915 [Rhodospirillales bacterium]|tara:strand:+ start:652 stop:882 length:231 start_codon:yes stop_codon:yes gene_type:complete
MKDGNIPRKPGFPAVHIANRIRHLAGDPLLHPRKEPFLEDVMSDPIIRQVIAADDLSERDVRRAIERVQSGLRLQG